MSSTIKTFEKQLKIYLDDIRNLIKDKPEILKKIDGIIEKYALKALLPEDYIIKCFIFYVKKPYGEYILKSDENYFMNLNYGILYDNGEENFGTLLGCIFKDIWQNNITKENKDKLWMRMKILVKLCEKWEQSCNEKTS